MHICIKMDELDCLLICVHDTVNVYKYMCYSESSHTHMLNWDIAHPIKINTH